MNSLKVSTYSLNLILESFKPHLGDLRDSLSVCAGLCPTRIADHVDDEESLLELLIANGWVGVWDSASHGRIVWLRIKNSMPLYVPVACLLEGRCAKEISLSSYRAVLLDLNNALLQSEGFE